MDVITVGGPPGSGTSTVCMLLKEQIGMDYLYAGKVFRNRAESLSLSLASFGKLCEEEPAYDIEIDELMLERARKGQVILEGRMIGPLCSVNNIQSLKVYIDAEAETRAYRLMERDGGEVDEVKKRMKEREDSEIKRYLEYYGIDPRNEKWYDLVIDSTGVTPDYEVSIIIDLFKKGDRNEI